MTSYRTTMRQALEEMYQNLNEDNLDLMRKAAGGAKQTLKMKDGKIGVDSFTASAIMQIYDKINDKNKKTFENMMKNGKKADIMKLQKFAMSKVNASYASIGIDASYEEFEEEFGLDEAQDGGDFKPHMMYDPKTGKGYKADTMDDHLRMKKMGYTHDAPKKEEVELDEVSPNKQKSDVIVMKKGNVEKSVVGASGVKKAEKEGYKIQYALLAPNGKKVTSPKDIMKAIKSADKLGIGEEVELDEATKQVLAHGGKGKYKVTKDGDKIEIKFGGKVVGTADFDRGADSFFVSMKGEKGQKSFDDAQAIADYFAKNKITEEVELDEAKYDLYHKDFSSAMKHAYKMAKKLHGITVDSKEIDDKVASGPRKPSEGKTNSYRLEGDKGAIQVQVYNKGGPKPFELNFYKEEVDLDEKKTITLFKNKQPTAYDRMRRRMNPKDRKTVDASDKKQIKDLESRGWHRSPYDEEVEDGAAADARRAMRADPDMKQKGFSKDVSATDDDRKAASKNIMMQMRKAQSLKGRFDVEFQDGKKTKVPTEVAMAVQKKYNSLRKPADKEKFQAKVGKSYKDMLAALKEGFASDAQRRAAFASGYKEKGKKKKESTLERMNKKIQEKKNG